MTDLNDSLQRMGFMQLALLFGFLTTYVLALGGLLHGRARVHCAALAAACAVGFAGFTDPWVNGALLVVFVVAGLGLFVLLSWLLARAVAPARTFTADATVPAQAAPDVAHTAAVAASPVGVGELRWSAATGQSKPT
jgi:hypothetical protein